MASAAERIGPRVSLNGRTLRAAGRVLDGRQRGPMALLPFVGPAVVASVAYVDPGNFATNIQGGAQFGYSLLWVVVLANVVAMLFQALSARLGIVTGRNLAELCRDHLPHRLVLAMWGVSEVAAMATDLAEFLGASLALSLLFHIPLMVGMVLTGLSTYAMLMLQGRGFRPLELAIGGLVAVISLSYLIETIVAPLNWGAIALHAVVPEIANADALTLAVGIFGATVMPHAIYLHSSLTQDRIPARSDAERRTVLRMSNTEVVIALGVAGLVNMAMLAMAAAVFHDGVHNGIAELGEAYRTLVPLLGGGAAFVFLVSLLASGLSSSTVGTMAGQVIMQGFVGFRIPIWVRRVVTMLPAFAVVAMGVDVTRALVLSQVVLSLALPVPMIALIVFCSRPALMRGFALTRGGAMLAWTAAGLTLAMNTVLLLQTAGVPIPFLGGGS
jgi:manganese transport protein